MNKQEYLKWQIDATFALAGIYTKAEIVKIMLWFDNIRGRHERDLVGDASVDAFLTFHIGDKHWNLYNSLMSRLFVYAPYILALPD
jgi:hypothetical protein